MGKQVKTTDFRGELIFLGTGTSVGVPAIGCGCEVCTSDNPKNKRFRASIALGLPEGNLLIDTTPDLRMQLLRENIGVIDAVVFTHEHADHVMGLDDLRLFPFYLGHPVPLYCEAYVEERIRKSFDYAFNDHPASHPGAIPQLEFRAIQPGGFSVLGAEIIGFRLLHGAFKVMGFRIGNIAYCTDTNRIPDETMPLLEGLEVLVGGAGESCDDVCGAKGLQCNRKSLELVNSCHRLEENFECSRCWSVGGQEYPAFSPAFPRQANACLINTKGKLFNCAKKPGFADNSPSAQRNAQARRLCGCFKAGTDLPHPQFP